MSARAGLLTLLRAALPSTYRVSARVATPDQIDTGHYAVRVFTKEVVPGPAVGQLTQTVVLWLVTGSADAATMDDTLDVGLNKMLDVLLDIPACDVRSVERGTMPDGDGTPAWEGYLFTLTMYFKIEGA